MCVCELFVYCTNNNKSGSVGVEEHAQHRSDGSGGQVSSEAGEHEAVVAVGL